jgi:hypothetical protein
MAFTHTHTHFLLISYDNNERHNECPLVGAVAWKLPLFHRPPSSPSVSLLHELAFLLLRRVKRKGERERHTTPSTSLRQRALVKATISSACIAHLSQKPKRFLSVF